jgi:Recombinase
MTARKKSKRWARQKRSAHARRSAAMRTAAQFPELVLLVSALRAKGLTYRTIAGRLNGAGVASHRGRRWHPTTVRRALAQADARGPS